jgi:hypothetical protein
MSVLASSSYQNVEFLLNRIRLILNDSEIQGGDVVTDTAPFTFNMVNSAFERVQIELATVGVETMTTEAWLINLPAMPISDPEGRLIVDDTGCDIVYPSGVGDVFSQVPQLPVDLVIPLKLWDRPNGSTGFTGPPLKQCNDGLLNIIQQGGLIDWQWQTDGLRFRGATQARDVKVKYEKQLAQVAAPTDPLPIRGVINAAAYHAARIFAESRGGSISPAFIADAQAEIDLLKQISARRRQRKQVRRKPYSGRGGRGYGIL